jgi:hypothetical protein
VSVYLSFGERIIRKLMLRGGQLVAAFQHIESAKKEDHEKKRNVLNLREALVGTCVVVAVATWHASGLATQDTGAFAR